MERVYTLPILLLGSISPLLQISTTPYVPRFMRCIQMDAAGNPANKWWERHAECGGLITKKLVISLLLSCSFSVTAAPSSALPDDWLPESGDISLCRGHYVPLVPNVPLSEDAWKLPMDLSANETELTLQGQSIFKGDVTLKQGSRYLHADKIMIDRNATTQEWSKLNAIGHIHYVAPGISIWGERASYFHADQQFHLYSASYRWYARHARGDAHQIDIDKDLNLHLFDANYTTCAPSQDTWMLKAKEIALYPKKGRAKAKHIRLDLLNVPVFYFPYIDYPIDKKRHSGFLFPSYGSTSNSGYELTVPYYWNIAPNYDLTLAGRWLTERGLESQTKARYLFSHSEGVLQWHFLPGDRKYGQFQRENRLSPPGGLSMFDPRIIALDGSNNRHAVNYRHSTHWESPWQFNVIFDYVSDDNYFVDLGNDINTASVVDLPQLANLSYYGEYWSHFFNVEEYQVLQPLSKPINEEIYKRQPQWVFQAVYPNQWLDLTFGLNGEMVNFAHRPDLITQEPLTVGQRFHLRPSLSLPWQGSWYYITPQIQLDWLLYSLQLGEDAESQSLPRTPSRSIPLYSVDSGLFFERDLQYKKYAAIQTLEPRVYYLYVPFRDQHLYPDFDSGIINFSYAQLFRDNRFSGRDRVGDTHQVSVSLMSRLLPRNGTQEWLRASIGQIFYFKDRQVALCEELGQDNTCPFFKDFIATAKHSDLLGQVEIHASPAWSTSLFWDWDSIHQNTEQAALTLQYQPSHQKIINVNYYWLRHDIAQLDPATGTTGSLNQADLSFLWPVNLHWEVLSLWRYDFSKHQTVEVLAGIEYNACCVALQLVGSRYRQSNNFFYPQAYATGVFMQVVFKGLSAIGLNNPDGRLKQKIPGYVPLSDRQQWITTPQKATFPPPEIPLY